MLIGLSPSVGRALVARVLDSRVITLRREVVDVLCRQEATVVLQRVDVLGAVAHMALSEPAELTFGSVANFAVER